jgi:hypothetical protein
MLMNHLCKPPAWVPFTVERGTNSEAIVGQIQRSPVLLVLLWYPESTDFDHPTKKKAYLDLLIPSWIITMSPESETSITRLKIDINNSFYFVALRSQYAYDDRMFRLSGLQPQTQKEPSPTGHQAPRSSPSARSKQLVKRVTTSDLLLKLPSSKEKMCFTILSF